MWTGGEVVGDRSLLILYHHSGMIEHPMILQVLPALNNGGVERGTVEISKAIVQCGWQSVVASSGGLMSSNISYHGATHLELPLDSKSPLTMYRNIQQLSQVIERYGVNLVHARSRAPAWAAYYAAKKARIPFVTTFHGIYGLTGIGKKAYNQVMTKGERVIAVSDFVREHILHHYACNSDHVVTIHRGADLEMFTPDNVTPGILAQLSQEWWVEENHQPIILMPSRLTRWKGQHLLLEALARLAEQDYLCLLLGDATEHPDYVEELKKQIGKLGLEGRVRFVGTTKHMTEAYALADVVVAPSIEPEAFGRTVVEAQAMGKLVIAANHGGHAETITHEKNGFLVSPRDADALSAAISRALTLPVPRRHEIGAAAIRHVWDHFSVAEMQRKTIELYGELLG